MIQRRIEITELQTLPNGNIEIYIAYQSHIGTDFVPDGEDDGRRFTASNGVTLCSATTPEVWVSRRWLYVQGDRQERSNKVLNVPLKFYNELKEAVREYNKLYGRICECIGAVLCVHCKEDIKESINFPYTER